jgi:sugar lactone lactonase YvrE
VIRPDGTVVRALTLGDKTAVASGIAAGPDGSIWVADTIGGRVSKYGPDGGPPLLIVPGEELRLTNVMDVAAMPDGTIFITDQSQRLMHANADGQVLGTYKTQFHPWYIAAHGDWLDVTYDQGMLSINLTTQEARESRVAEPRPQLSAPRGIAHGADGTLYILDAGSKTITAYQAQR